MNPTRQLFWLRAVMVATGLFLVLLLPFMFDLWPGGFRWSHPTAHPPYERMIIAVYWALGVCLLAAARDPVRHAILIDFTILSSLLHAAVMTYDAFVQEHEMMHLVGDVPILFALAGVLVWLHPRGIEGTSAAGQGQLSWSQLFVLLLLALVGFGLVLARRIPGSGGSTGAGPALTQTGAGSAPAPTRAVEPPTSPIRIDVLVNGAPSAVVTPDTPLVFTARLVNVAARDAAAAAEAREQRKEDIESQVAAGQLKPEDARWLLGHDEAAPPVMPLVVSVGADRVRFTEVDGKPVTLPWNLTTVEPAAAGEVSLDDQRVAEIVLVGTPNTASPPENRAYEYVLSFENAAAGQGRWAGVLRSRPVTITVKQTLTEPAERAARALAFAEYFVLKKDLSQAMSAIEGLLRENPRSIRGQYLRGVTLEAQGDFQGALEAYQTAVSEARRYDPGMAPPWDLAGAVPRMWEKLGISPDEVIR